MTPSDKEIEAFVAALSYRPGWEFAVACDLFERFLAGESSRYLVRASWAVPDVHGLPGDTTVLTSNSVFYPERERDWRDGLARLVYDLVADLEGHERLEQLKVDGKPVWRAHQGGVALTSPPSPGVFV